MKALLKKSELYLTLVLIGLCLTIGFVNPTFFAGSNAIDLLKATVVRGIMAFGLLVVIISGGIDISFPSIAVTCLYTVASFEAATGYSGSPILLIIMAALMGAAIGLINGFLIGRFRFHPLIVTLATSRIIYGILISICQLEHIPTLGESLSSMSTSYLLTVEAERGNTTLPVTILVLAGIIVLVYVLLNRTVLGRMIYSIGSDYTGAIRAGFPVKKLLLFVYAFSGFAGGLAGICHGVQARSAVPTDLFGGEMMIVAMVVLGGASLSGGKGSVWGNVLGILIVTVTSNSLILMGIPTIWQTFVLGVIILIGTAVSSYQQLRASKKRSPILNDEEELNQVAGKEGG